MDTTQTQFFIDADRPGESAEVLPTHARRNYQAVLTGAGAISAGCTVYGSADDATWEPLVDISISGEEKVSGHAETNRQWRHTKAVLHTLTGTDARFSLYMDEAP